MVDPKTITTALMVLTACTSSVDSASLRQIHPSEGLSLLRQGRTSEARARLEHERSMGSRNPHVAWGLGRVYAMEGLSSLARKEYERALLIRESMPEAEMDLAALDYDEGNTAACLERLERLTPNDIVLWNRCLAHLKSRDAASALVCSRLLVDQSPEKAAHWELHGLTALACGERTEARLAFERLLKIQPDNVCAQGNLEGLKRPGTEATGPTRDFAFLDAVGASGWLRTAISIPGDRARTRSGP
ncbi:MAG: tetratricopeptide repeat protein [Planctomycetota bacterium]